MDEDEIQLTLAQLREAHRDLDDSIGALVAGNAHDQLQIQRLKRKKLMLKDEIAKLEDNLLPDIIA